MKKKIAFVIPGLESGGAERVVSTLANELCHNYDIIIVTLWNVEPFYHLHSNIKHINCADRPLISTNLFQALNNNIYLFRNLRSILKDHEIDISIGFTTTANILAILASKINKIRCIVCERSNPNVYVLNNLWNFLRKRTYNKADYIVVQTKENQSYFSQFTTSDKVIVLPNPLSSELINNKNKSIPKENIVLSVGRLDTNKSQDLLINAFSNINNEGWRLIFVGEGGEKRNYQKLTHTLGLDSKVSFMGNKSSVHDHYNSSKIFAFTSKSEGFPNVLIEAMYFELPCISTNCPSGPSDIISDGYNGFLIPVDDQHSLEKKLTLLMASEECRKLIGENASRSVEDYKTDNVVEKWDKLIQELL